MNEVYPIDFHGLSVKDINKILRTSVSDNKLTLIIEQNAWLGDVLNCLPHGIVNKNVTGIGATTLELESERDSIIVVPTKALAYGKYKNNRKDYFYLGSPITGKIGRINNTDIVNYIQRKDIYKKFIVVADSLVRLLNVFQHCQIDVYSRYFIMIDEVDIFQSDVTYRPVLENVIDYYLRFNEKNRCLVSATIREFSHPIIQRERVVYIDYPQKEERVMNLIHTNNLNRIACDKILWLLEQDSSKILVAYNYITEIHKIIQLLRREKPNLSIGILCSNASELSAGDFYTSLDDDDFLTHQVTFITCAYFVGIDIKESCHVISISSTFMPFTLLSAHKLTQIKGRCREGALSETFIFNTSWKISNIDINKFTYNMLQHAKDVVALYEIIDKICDREDLEYLFGYLKSAIQDKLTGVIAGEEPIPLSRKDIYGNYQISFFNIDALVQRKELKANVFTSKKKVLEMLVNAGIIPKYQKILKDQSSEEEEVAKEVDEMQRRKIANQLNKRKLYIDNIGDYENPEEIYSKYMDFFVTEEHSNQIQINRNNRINEIKEILELSDDKFRHADESGCIYTPMNQDEIQNVKIRLTDELVVLEQGSIGQEDPLTIDSFRILDTQLNSLWEIGRHEESMPRFLAEYYKIVSILRRYYKITYVTEIVMHLIMSHKTVKENRQRSLIFHAMDETFPFKKMIMDEFKVNENYSSDEIESKMSKIYINYMHPISVPRRNTIISQFNQFVGTRRGKRREGDKRRMVYEVLNYNPQNLPEPISKIKLINEDYLLKINDENFDIYRLMLFNRPSHS